jgi:hypothetical protein
MALMRRIYFSRPCFVLTMKTENQKRRTHMKSKLVKEIIQSKLAKGMTKAKCCLAFH